MKCNTNFRSCLPRLIALCVFANSLFLCPALAQTLADDFNDEVLASFWTLEGLGNATQQSVNEAGGVLEFTADGTTAFLASDNAGFLYVQVTGDFRVEATVDGSNMATGGNFRKAGLMVRTDLDPWSQRVLNLLVPFWNNADETHLQMVARREYRGSGSVAVAQDVVGVPRILRLAIERRGDVFTVEYSIDGGASWIQPTTGLGGAITINLPETLLVGMTVVSNNISETSTADFDDFTITGNLSQPLGQLLITAAQPDLDTQELLITGVNFGNSTPFAGQVSLFLPDTGPVDLSVLDFQLGDQQQLLVQVPSLDDVAGTFLLTVQTGPDQERFDAFPLTVGAVGPEGQPGPPGQGGSLGPFTLGDIVQFEAPEEVVAPTHVPVIAYEVRIPRGGDLRVEYDLFERGSFLEARSAHSTIFVNDEAIITYKSGLANSIRVEHDLIGLAPGDKITVNVKVQNADQAPYIDAFVSDFRLMAAEEILHFTRLQ